MFGDIISLQTIGWIGIGVGLLVLGSPELFKALTWLRGAGASVKLPSVPSFSNASDAPGLIEAAEAAETLQRWYGCRCSEAQKKLQAALSHFHDPARKSAAAAQPVDPAIAAQVSQQVTEILAARTAE